MSVILGERKRCDGQCTNREANFNVSMLSRNDFTHYFLDKIIRSNLFSLIAI